MPDLSKNDVVLVRYPFSNLAAAKVRPAVLVGEPHSSQDNLIVPITSKTRGLLAGEFVLSDWRSAGLNLPSAIKRGVYTIHRSLIIKTVGQLTTRDSAQVEQSLRTWFGLK